MRFPAAKLQKKKLTKCGACSTSMKGKSDDAAHSRDLRTDPAIARAVLAALSLARCGVGGPGIRGHGRVPERRGPVHRGCCDSRIDAGNPGFDLCRAALRGDPNFSA